MSDSNMYCYYCNKYHKNWKYRHLGRCRTSIEVDPATFSQKKRRLPDYQPWTRESHHTFSLATNDLFATLFLGIQRLEDTDVLPLAHQAMLEEMLECWYGHDNTSATYLFQDTLPNDDLRYTMLPFPGYSPD